MSETPSTNPICGIREEDGVVVFEVQAKYLNYDISDGLKLQLCEEVDRRIANGASVFLLDLAKVSIVDSCGVGLMIGLHQFAQERGGRLHLCGITSFLAKIFRMMHLDQHFHTVESLEELRQTTAGRE